MIREENMETKGKNWSEMGEMKLKERITMKERMTKRWWRLKDMKPTVMIWEQENGRQNAGNGCRRKISTKRAKKDKAEKKQKETRVKIGEKKHKSK